MKKVMKSPYFIIVSILVLTALLYLLGWYILPTKDLNVLIINKTVGAAGDGKKLDYRKHEGILWVINADKYMIPEEVSGTREEYKVSEHYYGPHSVYQEEGELETLQLGRLKKVPDVIYLSDTYGIYKENEAGAPDLIYGGLTEEEVSVVSNCMAKGALVIGEYNIASNPTSKVVRQELENLFQVEYTRWFGRYFAALNSDEVPDWVRVNYEQRYGKRYNLTGAGIVIASDEGELLILKEGTDFEKGGGVTIQILPEYKEEFPFETINYYGWFEFLHSKSNAEIVAGYSLEISEESKASLGRLGLSERFPAVVRTKDDRGSYYFAGDFSDFTGLKRSPKLLFAPSLFRAFSVDKPGDTTNFYWKFYVPFLQKLLKGAKCRNLDMTVQTEPSQVPVLNGKTFDLSGEQMKLWGVNINGVMPGEHDSSYPKSAKLYKEWFQDIAAMGANCIRVFDLMPPAFYSALEEYNILNPEETLLFIQNINAPKLEMDVKLFGEIYTNAYSERLKNIMDAVYGNTDLLDEIGEKTVYSSNVSKYLLAFTHDFEWTEGAVKETYPVTSSGNYFKAENNAGKAEQWVAAMLDYTAAQEESGYGLVHVQSVVVPPMLAADTEFTGLYSNRGVFDGDQIIDVSGGHFYISHPLTPADPLFLDNMMNLEKAADDQGDYPYLAYLKIFNKATKKYPILVDSFGLPTNVNIFESYSIVNGLSEEEQGEGIVRMMKAIHSEDMLGGLLYEWCDSWSKSDDELGQYVIPKERNTYWHNVIDPEQNFGITAVESSDEGRQSFALSDSGVMSSTVLSSDETYLYITVNLNEEINYKKNILILGLDTYDRNLGEYLYDKKLYATSLSGMEYTIRFENTDKAALYVTPQYNTAKKRYASDSSYRGKYDFVCDLNYGSFSYSNTQFYKTGSSIFIRLPWSAVNFADPSRHMVIHSPDSKKSKSADGELNLKTVATNGIMFSMLVADRKEYDTIYRFPVSKSSTGYRAYSWLGWDVPKYKERKKKSYQMISDYLNSLDKSGAVSGVK